MNRGSGHGIVGVRPRRASMRPRFMNRGSGASPESQHTDIFESFNEAPIHESGKLKMVRRVQLRKKKLQ